MKTQKSPDCQHLQFSTHCQFIANNSAKVAWRKMLEKKQYICSILHDHAMTIQWKFTILHQKMRFLTSENMIYGTRWLCFKTDEKKLIRSTWCWKGRCHYWKIGKLPRRQLFFYIFKLKHSWGYRRTWGPSRIYIYISRQFIYPKNVTDLYFHCFCIGLLLVLGCYELLKCVRQKSTIWIAANKPFL